MDLCGLTAPAGLEGTSLVPLLNDPDAQWDRPAFTVQTRGWHIGRSVRTERWRYTQWDDGRRGSMLFDHQNDPRELKNLAGDPEHAAGVGRLKSLIQTSPIAAQ